ncbi:hypothetical protein AAG906_006447 [Vitis piasezkii]
MPRCVLLDPAGSLSPRKSTGKESSSSILLLKRHADKTWKTHDLAANDHPLGALKAVGYMEGTFYCHFSSFHLEAFNIAGQELSLVMTTCPALDHLDDSLFNYLLEVTCLNVMENWRAMFLGETSFCVSAGGETEIIANRVDYQHDGVPEFQTLDLCSFDEYNSRDHDYLTWQRERKEKKSGECQDLWVR